MQDLLLSRQQNSPACVIRDQPQDVPGFSVDVETDSEVAQGEIHNKWGSPSAARPGQERREKRKKRHLLGTFLGVSTCFPYFLVLLT